MRKTLAIDGGRIKGVYPAAFLASIESHIEGRVADYFDLIVGTSTGGIIALGLGLGMTAHDVLGFYQNTVQMSSRDIRSCVIFDAWCNLNTRRRH